MIFIQSDNSIQRLTQPNFAFTEKYETNKEKR
jgi:hypothetical protein